VGFYEPYLRKVPVSSGSSSPDAAAIGAAHRTLTMLHPESASVLDAARAASLAEIPDGPARSNGVAIGVAAADAKLDLRAKDGAATVVPYTPGTRPGDWHPTPPASLPAVFVGLGDVAPFGIESGAQFRAAAPPSLHSRKYARDYHEVKAVGDVNSTRRPHHRTNVARFYSVTDPVGIYHPAARQVSVAQGKTLPENARIFALLAMSVFDAGIACFETKYHHNLWRPVTAIRTGEADLNRQTKPDPHWLPLIFTPPFPSYPSAHATSAGAARAVLEHSFGAEGHAITLTNPEMPEVVLCYTAWEQITDDIDDARIYGGIHFRFDQEAGARQGRRVGEYVLRHELRRVRGSDCNFNP
jgi:hypothetical protein